MSYTKRFQEMLWFDPIQQLNIYVLGVGGIGSWLCLFLNRTGASVTMVDKDYVGEENIGSQLFLRESIKDSKVDAMKKTLSLLSDVSSNGYVIDYDSKTGACPFMFSCFDNLEARKTAFEAWLNLKNKELFIDGRLFPEGYQVFCVKNDEEAIKRYKESLETEDQMMEPICTAKTTSFVGAQCAGEMMQCLTTYLTNKSLEVPLQIENYYILYLPVNNKYERISYESLY